jgi:exosortase A-associated hydrolase 1
MGDSAGAPAGFANVAPDIAAALDAFQSRCPAVVCFALCGLCEGASSALIYHADSHDRRVAALALLNPWVRSETTLAKTFVRHYYARRIASRAFWSRLLRGGVDVSAALRGAAGNARTALGRHSRLSAPESSFQSRMAEGLRAFPGPVFVALSKNDLTAREFAAYAESDERWRGLLGRESVTRFEVADADHTFSSSRARAEFEARMLAWVASLSPLTGECGESSLPADHGARTVLAMPATTGEAKSCP